MVHTITYSYSCSPDGPHHVEIRLTRIHAPTQEVRASFYCAFSSDRPSQNTLVPSGHQIFNLVREICLPAPSLRQVTFDGMTSRLEIQCGENRGFYEWWGELPETMESLRPLVETLEDQLASHLPRATERRDRNRLHLFQKAQ